MSHWEDACVSGISSPTSRPERATLPATALSEFSRLNVVSGASSILHDSLTGDLRNMYKGLKLAGFKLEDLTASYHESSTAR